MIQKFKGIGTSEYPVETAQGYLLNSNVDPVAITEPFIFEMPNLSATAQVRLSIAVTGQTENWGGCVVYIALDRETYQRSSIIFGGALYATTTSILDDY